MKYYDRETETAALERNRAQSEKTAGFTVLIGRRRIGKTALIMESLKKTKHLYLFVSRQTEPLLCAEFQKRAEAGLGLRIFGAVSRFRDLFEALLRFAETEPYTLVIDEFQELERVNPAIFSEIQDLWDRYKSGAKINFIACGSIYSLMMKIFEHQKEPLFGRQTSRIHLRPFKTAVIKRILKDHNPVYTSEDLLCLYMLSGGVPKYIELLMDGGAMSASEMLNMATRPDSPFLNEGRELLISEFGRDYGTYFSILRLIAAGKNSQSEIDSIIGKNTGAYLANLEREYSLVTRIKPMFSKPESRNGRWKIGDQFLRFWFRFVYPNQSLIETGQNALLRETIRKNYETYSGPVLEDYFRQKIGEAEAVNAVGSFWDTRGENEIDLIALNDTAKTALVAEVKRNPQKIQTAVLALKAGKIGASLAAYTVEYRGLSMEDM